MNQNAPPDKKNSRAEYMKAYRLKNKEKLRRYDEVYKFKNRRKISIYNRNYYVKKHGGDRAVDVDKMSYEEFNKYLHQKETKKNKQKCGSIKRKT